MKQPDLIPGVRDEERPTPALDVPFTLTPEVARHRLKQLDLVSEGGRLVDGHARWQALRELSMDEEP